MGFIETLCADCGKCLETLPKQRHSPPKASTESIIPDAHPAAIAGINATMARWSDMANPMTVAEVWDAVRRDKMFYDNSGGGVTVSGGEPLLWSKFVRELV